MKLSDIQPNLFSIIQALPFMAGYQNVAMPVMMIDDGNQFAAMENALNYTGLAVLLMPPQCTHTIGQSNKQVTCGYSTTVWVRTNPKIKTSDGTAVFNPLVIEQQIIPAVIKWTPGSNLGQKPFALTDGLEPESDFTDIGNNSRLIRFSTQIVFSQSTQ